MCLVCESVHSDRFWNYIIAVSQYFLAYPYIIVQRLLRVANDSRTHTAFDDRRTFTVASQLSGPITRGDIPEETDISEERFSRGEDRIVVVDNECVSTLICIEVSFVRRVNLASACSVELTLSRAPTVQPTGDKTTA